MKRNRHLIIVSALILISTVVMYPLISADFFDFGLLPRPEAASAESEAIDLLMRGHFVLIAFLFSVVAVPLLYVSFVFRQEEGDETDAPHIHGNTTLEIVWTVAPILLVIGFAVWGSILYGDVVNANEGEQLIRAQAYKWDWTFYYPELENQSNPSLVVRVDQPVVMEMQSRDVIHAFWVPSFRVKQDILPYNTDVPELGFGDESYEATVADSGYQPQVIRFTPIKEGIYRVRCAEICGTAHYGMLANVFVLSDSDYDSWVAGEYELPVSDPIGGTDLAPFYEELEQYEDSLEE